MYDHIMPEQFLDQPEEIQEVFINWWKPKMYDMFFRAFGNNPNNFLHGIFINYIGDNETLINATKDKSFLPLLSETQLRNFIEEKADSKISLDFSCTTGNYIMLLEDREYWTDTDDLLIAYWHLACRIAKEKLKA